MKAGGRGGRGAPAAAADRRPPVRPAPDGQPLSWSRSSRREDRTSVLTETTFDVNAVIIATLKGGSYESTSRTRDPQRGGRAHRGLRRPRHLDRAGEGAELRAHALGGPGRRPVLEDPARGAVRE